MLGFSSRDELDRKEILGQYLSSKKCNQFNEDYRMNEELPSRRQINHKVMRVIVGIIALSLSPAVWLLSGSDNELTSISISYWTDSRDVFVGSLIAVGFFLSAYNGTGVGRDWEYYLSKMACFFAICVAIFPTKGFSEENMPAKWVQAISNSFWLEPRIIHGISAVLLFACLIALMWFFSVRARKKGKKNRANLYRLICVLMVVGIVVLFLIGNSFDFNDTLFWVEFWGLSWFGCGWLLAGSYKSENQST
ncbi:MAG: hypothetical protein COB20_11010 [SAR86 cluster bacterium]|uniref:DUF998 domain-containing protein n=1 Tax=SAR86 cluster bacterium TaxID=2030880 RepID=A0A2A4X2M7_9GAMM|nr:MAG: hypothetical protein COB20_11010 [SAR86 cluster bacterium]